MSKSEGDRRSDYGKCKVLRNLRIVYYGMGKNGKITLWHSARLP